MDAFLAKLGRELADLERTCAPSALAVAFSGGIDSTVLLAGCRRLGLALPLRALHVDHGLHPDSERWARHCRVTAAGLGVELVAVRCAVRAGPSQSVEAAAREARYQALGELLRAGEMLLTAHHEDDQLETVFMRLLRGAGVKGLRGILKTGELAQGYLGRPLLAFSKAEIEAAAARWGLAWVEDPANVDQRFDRNYLRASVLPALKRRWPAVARTVSRTAAQMTDAQALLEALASADAGAGDRARIPVAQLRDLDAARQRNLLRFLIDAGRLPLPTAAQLEAVVAALGVSRPGAQPCVRWPGAEARIYAGHLYLMPALTGHSPADDAGRLSQAGQWLGPEGRLELRPAAEAEAALPEAWLSEGLTVRFRRGGERFKPHGAAHRRTLKKLLQEARIVPWMRSRIPLLYRRDALVAVGDLWVCEEARTALATGRAWKIRWSEHPPLR